MRSRPRRSRVRSPGASATSSRWTSTSGSIDSRTRWCRASEARATARDPGRMTPDETMQALRRAAADHAFFTPGNLGDATARFGFVQADPIRAPARAQDLILRHRVAGYKAGDLERGYPKLPLVEDMVHVYGFLHRRHR